MILTERELRHIIREAIIMEEGLFDFMFKDKEGEARRARAKERLEKYKKLQKANPNWDLSDYAKEEFEEKLKNSHFGQLKQLGEEGEELMDMLMQSMSKEERKRYLRKQVKKKNKKIKDGTYYKDLLDII